MHLFSNSLGLQHIPTHATFFLTLHMHMAMFANHLQRGSV